MNNQPFIKMHGAGNDYVFIDEFQTKHTADSSLLAATISHRNFGIGSDGLVVMEPTETPTADVRMRMWNADGSAGNMCGNAARCVALWMELQNRCSRKCVIETETRLITATTIQLDRLRQRGEFCVNLGSPEFDSDSADRREVLTNPDIPQLKHSERPFVSVSMGNPHAVFFVEKLSDQLVRQAGALIENHQRFPHGTNVEWVRTLGGNELQVRVWERGSGETLACGSGACAAAVAAIQLGHCERENEVAVRLPGGTLKVEWTSDDSVRLTGPSAVSFVGNHSFHAGTSIAAEKN